MAPRDHRIHLGRRNSFKNQSQNHSSTKHVFSGPFSWPKKVPRPKCWPDPSKISPEADFGNFSKSLQKERTANPSEILSRIHFSKFQTEPRGEKHVVCLFSPHNSKVWCWKPNIYALFLSFGTYTWDAWCWKPIFRENVSKTLIFTRFGRRRGTRKRIHRIQPIQRIHRKWSTAGSLHPRLHEPEARMTVIKQTPSNYLLTEWVFDRVS